MTARRALRRAAASLALFAAVGVSSAQSMALVPRPAEGSGCTVQVPSAMLQSAGPETRHVVRWDGACVGGSAQGLGTLSVEGVSGASQWKTDLRQTVMAGLPFGYQRAASTINSTLLPQVPSVMFIHDGLTLSFSEGWGLSLQGIEVGAPVVKVPEAGASPLAKNQFISNGFKTLMLMQANCLLHKSLPVCSGRENSEFFALVEFDDTQPGAQRFSTRRTTPCPDMLDISSCAPLVKQLGTPLTAEILGLIQRAKPDVEGLLQRMSARASAAPTVAPAIASGATGPAPQPLPTATPSVAGDAGLIPGWVAVKTRTGCEMQAPANWANYRRADPAVLIAWEWDGACFEGRAQGVGRAGWTMTGGPDRDWQLSWRYSMHLGRPFGYWTESSRIQFKVGAPAQFESAGVIVGNEVVRWSEGWGLDVKGVEVGASPLPRLPGVAISPKTSQRIVLGSRTLVAQQSSCLGLTGIEPGCPGGVQQIYFVTEMSPGESMSLAGQGARTRFVCPDPRDLAACAPLIQQTSAPMKAQIAALIDGSRPSLEALTARMNAALGSAAGSALPSVTAADLERLSVGALFALADELGAKGDKAAARSALRALFRRFPDHPLAATAARQLAALQ